MKTKHKFTTMGSIDIIKLLNDKLMNHVIRQIFSQLDEETVQQAELVSKVWWKVISEECIWKFVLRNKVLNTQLWGKFVCWRDIKWQTGPVGQDGHFYFKNIYKKIKEQLKKLERNWITSNYTSQIIDCGMEGYDDLNSVEHNEKYIACGMLDYTAKLWNRRTLDCEKVFRGHQEKITCFHIDQNFLITGSKDGSIKVCDLETTDLLNTVRDSLGPLHYLKFKNEFLVSVSADFTCEHYCLTVRQMSSPQNISVGTCVALNDRCFGLDFNEKYIIIPTGDPIRSDLVDEYPADIRVYSLSTLEVVRTFIGVGAGHLIENAWHLLGNLIIVGCDEKKISFWDIDTGERKRTIKDIYGTIYTEPYDSDTEIYSSGFNENYLVTLGSDNLKIWDLQAAMDLNNPDSYPFLLATIEISFIVDNLIVDDFRILGILADLEAPYVVGGRRRPTVAIWDFLPSPV